MRDLHDDGMCPPVKGVNMRRKQNACDSNGGVHAERVTANMHDLTYGLKDFFREVFLDKDDIDYERRFDVRSLPLLVVAMAAGWLYSRDGNGFYACVSAIFVFPILCISSSIEARTSCACSVGKIFSVSGV